MRRGDAARRQAQLLSEGDISPVALVRLRTRAASHACLQIDTRGACLLACLLRRVCITRKPPAATPGRQMANLEWEGPAVCDARLGLLCLSPFRRKLAFRAELCVGICQRALRVGEGVPERECCVTLIWRDALRRLFLVVVRQETRRPSVVVLPVDPWLLDGVVFLPFCVL